MLSSLDGGAGTSGTTGGAGDPREKTDYRSLHMKALFSASHFLRLMTAVHLAVCAFLQSGAQAGPSAACTVSGPRQFQLVMLNDGHAGHR